MTILEYAIVPEWEPALIHRAANTGGQYFCTLDVFYRGSGIMSSKLVEKYRFLPDIRCRSRS